MSRASLALAGLLLAASGFAVGHYAASGRRADATSSSRGSLSSALADPDPYLRAARLAALLPSLGPEAVPEVRKTFESSPGFPFGPAALELLMNFWASHEPEAAARWAFSSAPPGCSIAAIQPAVERWARADPLAAAQYLRSPGLYHEVLEVAEVALVRGWFQSGKPGLEEYIRDLGLGVERQRALATLAGEMIRRDGTEAVRRWAEGLPDRDERFKLEAFTQVAAELAKADPAAATAFCEAHCDEPHGANMPSQIATHWGARDGLAAMRWVATLPPGWQRNLAVVDAFWAWRHYDAQGLNAWMEAMEVEDVEPWFRPVAGRYAVMLARTNPTEALEWAGIVEDDQEREIVLISVARRWRRQDEKAAEAWLQSSPLSEEARQKARTLAPVTPPPRPGAESPPGSPS